MYHYMYIRNIDVIRDVYRSNAHMRYAHYVPCTLYISYLRSKCMVYIIYVILMFRILRIRHITNIYVIHSLFMYVLDALYTFCTCMSYIIII